MEYKTDHNNNTPNNDLEYFANPLEHHNRGYNPGINDVFLNNLDPMFCAMQIQNPDVLPHTQMKRQVDPEKFIDAQHPEI
jgi:hypothetical protein